MKLHRTLLIMLLLLLVGLAIVAFFAGKARANEPILSCTQAFSMGIHDIKQGSPNYRPSLDHDHDGVACEE